MIVFSHIPKTGGSSFREWFIKKLGREKIFWHREPGNLEGFGGIRRIPLDRVVDYLTQFEMIGGHFGFDEPVITELEAAGVPVLRTCMLREPFERLISHFDFVAQRPNHGSHTSKSFDKALESNERVFRRNRSQQNRYLSGSPTFETTRQWLNDHPCLIGTLEKKEAFLRKLSGRCSALGDLEGFPNENRGRKRYRPNYEEFRSDPRVARVIEEDRKLYRWVEEEHAGLFVHRLDNKKS